MSERKRILWLVSWYPNKYDPYDGDFIQRHARAAALYDDIYVLFVKQSEKQAVVEVERREGKGLVEQVIYIPQNSSKIGKIKGFLRWQKHHKTAVTSIIQHFNPNLVHVHVPWKAGLIALWIKRKYKIPYLVTEHWGIYNEIVDDNIYTKSFLTRGLLKRIFREADRFLSVSRYLGENVNKTVTQKRYEVIPNVVDTELFAVTEKKYERFTFLHVSNMVPLKNVEGIIKAFEQLLQITGIDAQLLLVGRDNHQYVQLAADLKLLNSSIFFKGEVPYADVAKEMGRSHVLVVNSNIENSPCVIGEALCCGLPVIATQVGGIPELVHPENSILIPSHDTDALATSMEKMMKEYPSFSSSGIAAAAKKRFSMNTVGQSIHEVYAGFSL